MRYKPDHRYILVVSGDAIEKERSKMLVDFLTEMGANNVAVIWVEPGIDPHSVVALLDIPQPINRVVLYWVKTLWKKIRYKK